MPNLRPAAPLLLVALALLPACSSAKPPQPVTPAQSAPEAAAAPAKDPAPSPAPAAPAPPAAAPAPEGKGGQVVVVDPGDDPASHSKTLVEAAREERERRAHAGEPVAVITNKNVAHSKGQITYAQPKAKAAGEKGKAGKDGKAKAAGETHDEAYWRHRGLDIRQRLHDASEEIGKLEQQVADWRQRFYSEDDPARRDAQIKPEWDRVLDRLQHKKEEVEATKHELDAYLEEGRKEGALPGWLREGAELEPAPPAPKPAPTDAIEPPVLDEKPPEAPLDPAGGLLRAHSAASRPSSESNGAMGAL